MAGVALGLVFFAVVNGSGSVGAQQPDPALVFNEAVAAQQRGDAAAALKLYQALVRQYPANVAVRVNLGGVLVELRRFDEAIADYQAGLTVDPQNRDLRLGLDAARQDKGDTASLEQARLDLEHLHADEPQNLTATMMLADVLNHQQQYARAAALLGPLEPQAAGDDDFALLLGTALVRGGQSAPGAERMDALAARTRRADAYLLAGEARLAMSQFDVALKDADAALAKDPAIAGGQTLRGMVLENAGDYQAAAAALELALKADADDFNANYSLGALRYFERNTAAALTLLGKAVELAPGSVDARYKLALAQQTAGKTDMALKNFEAVTRQRPEWLEAHMKLAKIYSTLGRAKDAANETTVIDRLVKEQGNVARTPAVP